MKINIYEHLSSPAVITGPVHKKEFIAIHWYGDPNTAGDVHATARYLAGATHASVNYVVGYANGEGHIYCLVNPTQVAYAQGDGGNGYGNLHGISIECDPRMRPEDLEVVAYTIAMIRKDFSTGFGLRPHKHFTQTACPGTYEAKLPWLNERANQINNGQAAAPAPSKPAAPAPAPGKGPFVPDPHWIVDPGSTLSKIMQSEEVKRRGFSQAEFVKFNGIKDPNKIKAGERLWYPGTGSDTWIVDPGDTLSGISAWYAKNGHKVSVQQLQFANGINNPSKEVKVGMRLLIP